MTPQAGEPLAWQEPYRAPRDLADDVACSWSAEVAGAHLLVPDGCIDLLWLDSGHVVVCGPERRAWRVSAPTGTTAVGVRLRPGVAPRLLRTDAHDLADRRLPLEDLLGTAAARSVSERVGAAPDRRSALVAVVRRLLGSAPPPDPVDVALASELTATRPRGLSDVADGCGLSVRQIHRRAYRRFGYGPSVLVQLVRLQRFLRRAETGRWSTLSGLAHISGYADQAHLARSCRKITGLAPSELLPMHVPTFPPTSDPYKPGSSVRVNIAGSMPGRNQR